MPILLFILFACSVGLAVYWSILTFHVFRTLLRIPTAARGVGVAELEALPAAERPRVCVIIPAHNEAACIAAVAQSIAASDYPNLTAVFSLDRCTDDTEKILRSTLATRERPERFEVFPIAHCPPEWAGKVNAIWRAVQDSAAARQADILLFIDADTTLHPRCITHTVALMRTRELGMLSLLSTLTCDQPFEFIAQTAAGMELARQYPIERANARTHRRAFANGQFLMFARDAYEQVGGHEAAKHALLEDMELARLCERKGVPAGLFLADGMHSCRMYANWREFRRGWKRIYTECANLRIKRLRALARRVRFISTFLPLAAITSVTLGALQGGLAPGHILESACVIAGLIGLGAFAAAMAACHKASRSPALAALAYPLGAWLVGGILHEAADDLKANKPTIWGGREYVRTAR